MHLNEIRTYGFKSFPDPITIKLNRGITGFVGPNGSGKSNVVDAIRWVLGEQSASELRASVMEDLIFNGTSRRTASNLCDVALKFTNDGTLPFDFSEFEIERKLFRSGDSQYLINKESVRLKDIQNLLADTGLGTRTYSLFKRSLVDDIVKDKADAIRNLFEESAGISIYRMSKKETQRKLAQAQENLHRINDLLSEIEKQERDLKRQASKAKRYKELTEIQRNLSEHVFRKKDAEFLKLAEEAEREISDRDGRIKAILGEIQAKKAEIIKIRENKKIVEDDNEAKRKSRESVQSKLHEASTEILLLQERVSSLEEQIRYTKINIDKHISSQPIRKERIEKDRAKIEEVSLRIEQIKKEMDEEGNGEIVSLYKKTETDFNELQASLRKNENELLMHKSKINTFNFKKETVEKKIEDKTAEIEKESETIENLKQEIEKINGRLAELERSGNDIDAKINENENRIREKRAEQKALNEKKESLIKEISSLKANISQIEERERESRATLEELKTHLKTDDIEMLRNLVTAREGYEEHLKTAIAFIINAFIISREQIESISGKNTPLIYMIDPSAERADIGNDKTLDKFIDAPDYIKRIFSHFAVSSTIDEAMSSNDGHFHVLPGGLLVTQQKIVIKSGEIKIINFKEMIKGINAEIESATSSLNSTNKMLSDVSSEISSIYAQNEKLKKESVESASSSDFARHNLKAVNANLESKNSYLSKLRQISESLKGESEELHEEIGENEEMISILEEQIGSSKESLELKEMEYSNVKEQYIIYNNRKNEIDSLFKDLNAEREMLEKEIAHTEEELKRGETEIEAGNLVITESEEKIRENRTKGASLEAVQTELQKELLGMDEVIRKLEESIDSFESAASELEDAVEERRVKEESLKEERESFLLHKEKYITERDINSSKIDPSFEIDAELIEKYIESAEEELRFITDKINSMGAINQLAFEEYAEASARLEQILVQKNDIVQSKENLEKTIRTIDAKAKTIFAQYFDTIRTTFKELFFEIFKSGNADIILTDENNPLESEIRIIFEPGDKKIGKLVQLSDGEKAMMIIALLFAMYMVRPTPVCIMDEIDGPLDDANVENFIKLLQKFRDRTQFVLITHNKRTMEFCDFLFGVTMEESGVTSIVSLNLQSITSRFLDNVS